MPSTVWIQFVKIPLLGKVKTRIAATIGDNEALDVHKRLSLAVNAQLSRFICESHTDRHQQLWLGVGGAGANASKCDYQSGLKVYRQLGMNYEHVFMQEGEGLGERMRAALKMALEVADQAFIVGSDFPVLDGDYLASALAALERANVVLGATEDGGYGLIGVNRLEQIGQNGGLPFDSFGDVSWGTDKVCQQTQNSLLSQGLEVTLLPKRFDVDEEKDWRRWLASAWNE